MIVYPNFINGEWVESVSDKTTPNINPANFHDIIGTVKLSTGEEARKAVEAAYDAFRDWKNTPAPTRGRIVAKAARLLEDNKEELAQILSREEGKSLDVSRA